MKSYVLLLLCLFLIGCGGTESPKRIEIPPNADIKAGLQFKNVSGARHAQVVFMYTVPVAPGSKDLASPTTFAVEDPKLDGEALTTDPAAGEHVYISNTAKQTVQTISARINGVVYEGKTIPGPTISNKQILTTLTPK